MASVAAKYVRLTSLAVIVFRLGVRNTPAYIVRSRLHLGPTPQLPDSTLAKQK